MFSNALPKPRSRVPMPAVKPPRKEMTDLDRVSILQETIRQASQVVEILQKKLSESGKDLRDMSYDSPYVNPNLEVDRWIKTHENRRVFY